MDYDLPIGEKCRLCPPLQYCHQGAPSVQHAFPAPRSAASRPRPRTKTLHRVQPGHLNNLESSLPARRIRSPDSLSNSINVHLHIADPLAFEFPVSVSTRHVQFHFTRVFFLFHFYVPPHCHVDLHFYVHSSFPIPFPFPFPCFSVTLRFIFMPCPLFTFHPQHKICICRVSVSLAFSCAFPCPFLLLSISFLRPLVIVISKNVQTSTQP